MRTFSICQMIMVTWWRSKVRHRDFLLAEPAVERQLSIKPINNIKTTSQNEKSTSPNPNSRRLHSISGEASGGRLKLIQTWGTLSPGGSCFVMYLELLPTHCPAGRPLPSGFAGAIGGSA